MQERPPAAARAVALRAPPGRRLITCRQTMTAGSRGAALPKSSCLQCRLANEAARVCCWAICCLE